MRLKRKIQKFIVQIVLISVVGYYGYQFYQQWQQPKDSIGDKVVEILDNANTEPIERPLNRQKITVNDIANSFTVQGINNPDCGKSNTTFGLESDCRDTLETVIPNGDLKQFFGITNLVDENGKDISNRISIDYQTINVYHPSQQESNVRIIDNETGFPLLEKNITILVEIPDLLTEADRTHVVGDFEFMIDENVSVKEANLTSYHGMSTEITIPATIKVNGEDYDVIGIDRYVFENKGIRKVKFPSTLKFIGESAFSRNELTEVILPDNVVNVHSYAFHINQITKVELPNVKIIGSNAFSNNQITEVELPNIMRIEMDAFENNQITSVTLASTLEELNHGAFSGNLIETVDIDYAVSLKDFTPYGFDYDTEIVYIKDGERIVPTRTFKYDTLITYKGRKDSHFVEIKGFMPGNETTDLIIPEVLNIDGILYEVVIVGGFYDSNLESVVLPANLGELRWDAFVRNNITEVEIPTQTIFRQDEDKRTFDDSVKITYK